MRARILDPKFKYVPAAATDITKTFAKARREMKEEEERRKAQRANVRDFSDVFKEKAR